MKRKIISCNRGEFIISCRNQAERFQVLQILTKGGITWHGANYTAKQVEEMYSYRIWPWLHVNEKIKEIKGIHRDDEYFTGNFPKVSATQFIAQAKEA